MINKLYNAGLNLAFSSSLTQHKEQNTQIQEKSTTSTYISFQANAEQSKDSDLSNKDQENFSLTSEVIKNISAKASEKLEQISEEMSVEEKTALDMLYEQLKMLQQQLDKTEDAELKLQLLAQIAIIMGQIIELLNIYGDGSGISITI
ncbi:hypothetical protein CQA38_05865 [Campylobacter sp. MIT 12-5580]|uniref:hypothetical protein n=1 Tax=Campylobacter sp. MIT 12-5580 TaxID=2040651 RepID=UPI0010F63725|nr:hypothetical protein [Campylobacter sp. MIT 12-5580]TKX29085.1 hypothetical protein CQA38_05865 [Campylobacter sp. MIT 12-5580]